jgi:trans-aconitate 2-methyltransferase
LKANHEPAAYYNDFSFDVGLRDWVVPNARHEQLKLLLVSALGKRTSLRILDVGSGAGVMSDYLTSFGTVVAVDFSARAIELGRVMAPAVDFRVGNADDAVPAGRYDVITLFDVLEHIPAEDRAGLLSRLTSSLEHGGTVIMSTPHPHYTRWLHDEDQERLQVIDEPVDVEDVVTAAAGSGLVLSHYETFDVDDGGPQYQFLTLSLPAAERAEASPRRELATRLRVRANPAARVIRRTRLATRLLRRGMPKAALWLIVGKGRPPRSLAQGGAPRRDA